MEALFLTHPYRQQRVVGYSDHLKNPSVSSVQRYFDTYYLLNNMVMILVDDIDHEDTVRWVDQYFGNFLPKTFPSNQEVYYRKAD